MIVDLTCRNSDETVDSPQTPKTDTVEEGMFIDYMKEDWKIRNTQLILFGAGNVQPERPAWILVPSGDITFNITKRANVRTDFEKDSCKLLKDSWKMCTK